MRRPRTRFALLIAVAAAVTGAQRASAVILVDREQRNLTPPTGSLLTAWDLQGNFANFDVTPIAPHQFVTANHIGAATSGVVTFQGVNYNISTATTIAGTDLRVYTIDGTFPTYAALWDASVDGTEDGRPMAVFGRGTQRGEAIVAPIASGPRATSPLTAGSITLTSGTPAPAPTPPAPGDIRGWSFGPDDRLPSWGRNIVDGTVVDDHFGELLSFSFSAGAGKVADEAGLSTGDSGGGLFVQNLQGQWKLAGINLGLDGPFSYAADGPYFNADLFDARGLYIGTTAQHELIPNDDFAIEGSSYSSRIGGANLAALRALTGGTSSVGGGPTLVPEPASILVIAGALALANRRVKSR